MPIRDVTKRTKNTVRYLVPSPKNGRVITCESTLERDMILRLEFAPEVVSYEEQAKRIQVPFLPKAFNTIPDFEVVLMTGEIIYIEVKYKSSALKRIDRLMATEAHLQEIGFAYHVMTEKEIRPCQMILSNLLYLKAFKERSANSIYELEESAPIKPTTFGELAGTLGRNTVVEMIAHQLVFIDLYQPIQLNSIIKPLTDGDYDYLYPIPFRLNNRMSSLAA